MGLAVLPIEVRDRLAGAKLNYREVGATEGSLPAGYHEFTRSLPIGYGHELFVAAGDAVRQWQVQLGAGLQVSASSPTAVAGTVLLLGLGIGSLRLRAPCRVVWSAASSATICPIPKLMVRMSGKGSHERIPDIASVCGNP